MIFRYHVRSGSSLWRSCPGFAQSIIPARIGIAAPSRYVTLPSSVKNSNSKHPTVRGGVWVNQPVTFLREAPLKPWMPKDADFSERLTAGFRLTNGTLLYAYWKNSEATTNDFHGTVTAGKFCKLPQPLFL